MAERLKRLRNYGQADRYRHVEQGVNSRLDEVQAAILRAKLPHLNAWNAARRERAHQYIELLNHFDVRIPQTAWAEPCWHLFVVHSAERDKLREHLKSCGIATEIHYPVPVHVQPCYSHLGYRKGQFPVAEQSCSMVLSLPLYPELPIESVAEVSAAVERFLR